MVVKTRRSRMSLRRSFRTRPSIQIPVIHVQHRDIELFDDVSSGSDVLLRSPILRRPVIKRKVQPKVFATVHACSVISEVDNDHLNMEKLNAEHDMAEDFSLYIENQGGIRMKAVGNRLIKYDDYHGVKLGEQTKAVLDDIICTQKIPREANQDAAECKRERRLFRRAAWLYVRKMLRTHGRNTPGRTAEKKMGTDVGMRTLTRFSTSVQPIEEACEVEFMGANLIPSLNLHETMNVPSNAMISSLDTPTIPRNRVFSFSGAQHGGRVTPKSGGGSFGKTYFHSDKFLSFSPLTAVENVEELNSSGFPISTYLPQAQSTPLTEEELQKVEKMTTQNYGNENALQEQFVTPLMCGNEGGSAGDGPHSFGSSPRWNNVTMRTKSRIMHMRSSNNSNIDEPVSSSIFNNFANLTISILQPPVELNATQEEMETSIDGVLEHNDSCDNVLTLAEEGQLQCTNTENFMERNVTTNMTVNNTYRSVSLLRNESFIDVPYYLSNYPHFGGTNTPLLQLLFIIEQAQVIEWRDLPKDVFDNPRKLGEGVYGEVFATKYNGQLTALKVIPFCGGDVFYKEKVNGEYLLDAAGILPEILINRELSSLSDLSQDFSTPNFIQLLKINVVKGLYPEEFLAAWDAYDNAYESENDRPSEYASEQQLFVAIGMAMGGVDLEHYQLANENQVLSVLFQIAISLVVAEERLEFEHRDLHVGNVLVVENDDNLEYRFSGGDMVLRSYGVKVHLIDFTLSRMSKEGTTVFRDLEDDEELFTGNGDYQFDIYRLMRNANQGDWLSFTPKSNCFWLHYLAVKLISQRRCRKAIPKKKRRELQKKWDHLLEFDSLRELFTHDDFLVDLQQHVKIKHPPPSPPPPSCE